MALLELLSDVRNLFPNKAIDLYESIELIQNVLNDTIKEISDKTSVKVLERNFDEVTKLAEVAKSLNVYENRINELLSALEVDVTTDYEPANDSDDRKILPNYNDYIVDSNVEHTLYENFTHIRPFGFKINENQLVEAATWQEMLIKTCELLIAVDKDKFLSFENNQSMNGKKNKYFSQNESILRKPGGISDQIYIELNQSSNSIRNLIMKLLKEYDYKVADYKVYYRADYTDLK